MSRNQQASAETDAFHAFSQIHLATVAERAVYWCFASDPDTCWSDAEVALSARVDISAARWALRRFADASIVEDLGEGCFRWRAALRYALEREEPETERRDPVCRMPVADDSPHRAEDPLGRTEYFCSERCMAAFIVWPLVFMRRPGAMLDRSAGNRHAP